MAKTMIYVLALLAAALAVVMVLSSFAGCSVFEPKRTRIFAGRMNANIEGTVWGSPGVNAQLGDTNGIGIIVGSDNAQTAKEIIVSILEMTGHVKPVTPTEEPETEPE